MQVVRGLPTVPRFIASQLVLMPGEQHQMSKKRILFIHPDLGIGGAERLVVDAAVGLQQRGHTVTVYTSHCDHRHCFDEARDGIHSELLLFVIS